MQKSFIVFILLLCSCPRAMGVECLDSLLTVLDMTIEGHAVQVAQRESRIAYLKESLNRIEINSSEHYNINDQLYKEYKPFICDSAIRYLNQSIRIAESMHDNAKKIKSKLQLVSLLSSSGMYMEAADVLKTIDRRDIDTSLITDYYKCLKNLYGALCAYTQNTELSGFYWSISQSYKDSLYAITPEGSDDHLRIYETILCDRNSYDEALKVNALRLAKTQTDTPQYALVTYQRSQIYKQNNDRTKQKINLCLSAISDIRSAIRDHASLWTLAQLLYEDGDLKRAYKYMRFSWNETRSYNTRLRNWQSADVLYLIDNTYQNLINKQNRQLQINLLLITLLLILLIIAICYIYCQMKKLAIARNHLQMVNQQLNEMNDVQKRMNANLSATNIELSESNRIKEEYITRFIQLCSTYINRLDTYRRMVNKKISTGKSAELLKITRSQNAFDEELQELYTNFDIAFLHIFPDFVVKFNELLQEDKQIILKKNELLNTELRIFALIRLGIDDSSKIAEFLRYSVNTIYNYRAKVKNKARGTRDNFEDLIRNIR